MTSGTAPTAINFVVLAAWTAGLGLLPLTIRPGMRRRGRSAARSLPGGGGTAVELAGVVKHYGPVTAVNGLDLRIPAGETVALLGPNGSGKTTTTRFRLLRGDPERFAVTAGVTALSADGDRVTLRTADATVWALYPERHAISDIAVAEASLEEAFLSLVATRADGTGAGKPPVGPSPSGGSAY